MSPEGSGRIEVLDSLRGIAAAQVLFHHFLSLFPVFFAAICFAPGLPLGVNLLAYTPLHLVWAGHEAVIFFFTLSGFVLALPYMEGRPAPYGAYGIRRFFRVYVPYFTLITLSFFLYKLQGTSNAIPGASVWLNSIWSTPISWKEVAKLYCLLGDVNSYHLSPTIWSLNHEMRVSVFFPLMALLVFRAHWALSFVWGTGLALVGGVWTPSFLTWEDLNKTVFYSSFFIYGAALAKYRGPITQAVAARGTVTQEIGRASCRERV